MSAVAVFAERLERPIKASGSDSNACNGTDIQNVRPPIFDLRERGCEQRFAEVAMVLSDAPR